MDRGAWWATALGSQRVRHDWVTNSTATSTSARYNLSYQELNNIQCQNLKNREKSLCILGTCTEQDSTKQTL